MINTLQRSGRLLHSDAAVTRCATRQIIRTCAPLPGRAFHNGRSQRVAAGSEPLEASRPLNNFIREHQGLVFEDKSKIDLPTSIPPRKFSDELLKKHPDLDLEFVVTGDGPHFHPAYLRDACPCPRCVDPSSTQKNFQTTDIPRNIKAKSVEMLEDGAVKISWENDVPGFGEDHVSVYPKAFFDVNRTRYNQVKDRQGQYAPLTWNKTDIAEQLRYITYDQYMTNDAALGRALLELQHRGLLIVRGVPESEKAVEDLTGRLGPIRDSFYGRTWDVKSVPEAKNVAYTQQYLGLHMDLLYMKDPPGFQFLHCLKNDCEGGESIFVDSFNAARQLNDYHFNRLANARLAYQYRNAGEHYYHEHRVFEVLDIKQTGKIEKVRPTLTSVNYSPPFQAPTSYSQSQQTLYAPTLQALRRFAARVEDPKNVFEYKLQPGECVIFNNRRTLHGRKQFEAEKGERWLKGAYVDSDVFSSRFRVLMEKFKSKEDSSSPKLPRVFPGLAEESFKARQAKRLHHGLQEDVKEAES